MSSRLRHISEYIAMHEDYINNVERSVSAFLPHRGSFFLRVRQLLYDSIEGIVEGVYDDLKSDEYGGIIDNDKEDIIEYLKDNISKL